MFNFRFRRILLKLSGEVLAGKQKFGIDPDEMKRISHQIKMLRENGIDVAVVVGGGNIFRGISGSAKGMDRATADYMGMLATVINALALQDFLEKMGVVTRVQTAIEMRAVAEPFIRRKALRHLEKGRVVIFAAGTGNPFFSTDTTAALRAAEIGAEAVLKATKVDGVYSADPMIDASAVKFDTITYLDVLNMGLKVMDSAAISLCMDNKIPIIVFNINDDSVLLRIVKGEKVGTCVK